MEIQDEKRGLRVLQPVDAETSKLPGENIPERLIGLKLTLEFR